MSSKVQSIIQRTVHQMIEASTSDQKIHDLYKKHEAKVHFIPIRYRIVGGILQSLNIRFGNFIETLIGNIAEIDPSVTVLPDSGKNVRLYFTPATDALIDTYITNRQLPSSSDDCTPEFDALLKEIIDLETSVDPTERQGIKKDVDVLFQSNGLNVYIEVKYNDDHDTGKFADINRKFIKTWAGLAVRLRISKPDELLPILYYFNSAKRYGPIHTPSRNIMRGPQLFDKFLQTTYQEVDECLSNIGDDPDILEIFDNAYRRVRNQRFKII
ncbi:MAG: hypothetical protein JXA97_09350 [Anaerolineales bacterium]|nr:hypothetical protein [Anaerolineales bacterium]